MMKKHTLPLRVVTTHNDAWFTAGKVYDVLELDAADTCYGFWVVTDKGTPAYCVLYGRCGWTGGDTWSVVPDHPIQLALNFWDF